MKEPGDLREHAEAGGGLAAGAFEFVIEDGIFEAGKIERGGMAHEADADVVGETVAEEGFGEAGGAHEEVAGDGEGEFGGDEGPEVVRDARFGGCGGCYAVNDEFGNPEGTQGHEGPQKAGKQGDKAEDGAGFPDHAEERRQVAEGVEAIAPGGWGVCLRGVGIHFRSINDYGGPRPAGRYLGESGLEATLARDSWYVTVMLWRLGDFVKSKDLDCWF